MTGSITEVAARKRVLFMCRTRGSANRRGAARKLTRVTCHPSAGTSYRGGVARWSRKGGGSITGLATDKLIALEKRDAIVVLHESSCCAVIKTTELRCARRSSRDT